MDQDIVAELMPALAERCQSWEAAAFLEIPSEDVAFVLGTLPDKVSKFMRIKYAAQDEYANEIEIYLLLQILDLATRGKWKYPKDRIGKELLRNIGRMAIAESIFPHVCMTCQGTKSQILLEGKVENCPSCGGSGKRRPSYRERADIMGFKHETWRINWDSRYKECAGILDDWESQAIGKFKKMLPGYFTSHVQAKFL